MTGTVARPGNGQGIDLDHSSNDTIGGTNTGQGNVIAFNTGNGVTVDTGTGDAIRQNSIFANGAGITLINNGNSNQPAPTVIAYHVREQHIHGGGPAQDLHHSRVRRRD